MVDMNERMPRPDWVRRINAMGNAVGGARHMVSLDVDELVALAERSTGLDDFGDFDGDWRPRLQGLVTEMEATANFHVVGRLMVRQELLRGLRTRLFVTQALKQHPEISERPIEAPIVITGPGRSGTSILFELLCLDPKGHGPLGWESAYPTGLSRGVERGALAAMTECEQELWQDVNPVIATVHEHKAELPVECIVLQIPSFSSAYWWIVADIPNWMPDMVASMRYHKLALQVIQHGRPDFTWVLKTPIYLSMMDLLYAFYPDAWVVRTHRDPVKTAVSGLNTMAAVRWQRSEHVQVGDESGGRGGGSHDQMVALDARVEKGELADRFVDIHFSDLMRDPVATVRAAYERMGREFSDEHARAIVDYLANKPRAKAGKHDYRPEDYGVDLGAIREQSRPYMEHFGVAFEDYE